MALWLYPEYDSVLFIDYLVIYVLWLLVFDGIRSTVQSSFNVTEGGQCILVILVHLSRTSVLQRIGGEPWSQLNLELAFILGIALVTVA